MPTAQGAGWRFPFGVPAGRCESHRVVGADAFLLGVYPSALHIRWTHPRHRVAALAVAPEPWPFWDGHDQAQRVDRWRQQVSWQPEWGMAEPAGRLTGSSGHVVQERVLGPLGLISDRVWLTDALPFFHVHRGVGTQGAAMQQRYDPFALEHGLEPHALPDRPPPSQLVARAVTGEGARLRAEQAESGASLVITLGNEALAVAADLLDGDLPRRLTTDDSYGQRLQAHADGRAVDVLPLVHPGQRSSQWQRAHDRWVATQKLTS